MAIVLREISALLTRDERRALVALGGLILVAMVLETLGIGLVLPALALLTEGSLAQRAPVLQPVMEAFSRSTREATVAAGMVVLVTVYFVKNAFLALLTWRQSRFTHALNTELSQRLLVLYLSQPYSFHLQRNSASLISNINTEVEVFTTEFIAPALLLCAELLVLAALGGLLLAIEPAGALMVGTLVVVVGWGFYRLTHPYSDQWGAARQFHAEQAYQHLQQTLGAAKEIILFGREREFLSQYFWHNGLRTNAAQRHDTLKQMPKLGLELLAIIALAGLTLSMVAQGRAASVILPTLGLFAAVAFRLLPSANRVLFAAQAVRFSLPALARLRSDFTTLSASAVPPATEPLVLERSIALRSVTYAYALAPEPALAGVSLQVAKGEFVGIIGASGAGKSTLIDVLLGLLPPTSGEVLVDGRNIATSLRGWQDTIGYVPQVIYLTDDTLRRNIAFGLPDAGIDETAVQRTLHQAQLVDFVASLPSGLDSAVGERGVRISGGERQRVGIARALYHDPAVLVLDEATSALDATTERSIMATVRDLRGRKTIVVVSHRMSTIEHCDRVFRLEGGQLIEVRPPETARSPTDHR